MNKIFRKKQGNESGAIMLELIAVLSVMALMGTMLYRQVYQRNQELVNVEMASEIRVIKEALAAWVQASPDKWASCKFTGTVCTPIYSVGFTDEQNYEAFVDDVESFLPEAFQTNQIIEDYTLRLYCEEVGENDRCQGLVVPTADNIFPDDWNFKRAARVAMLIGVDGGVYGPSITENNCFIGSMGTWELCDIDLGQGTDSIYIATTGLDIFQPEANIDANVKLKEDWDLVLRNALVYNKFAVQVVGSGSECYKIHHHEDVPSGGEILNDDIFVPSDHGQTKDCHPAFLVDTDGGHTVRVTNDLTVGQKYDPAKGQPTTATMRFDKNGMIVWEEATVMDPQTSHKINYVLDPQYTSVINDAKIMSRGGAKLSEILPNWILKGVYLSGSSSIIKAPVPECPQGYRAAIAITPTTWNQSFKVAPGASNTHFYHRLLDSDFQPDPKTISADPIAELPVTGTVDVSSLTVKGKATIDVSGLAIYAEGGLTSTNLTQGVCAIINEHQMTGDNLAGVAYESQVAGATVDGKNQWVVGFSYSNKNDDCKLLLQSALSGDCPDGWAAAGLCISDGTSSVGWYSDSIAGIAQTYCVFDETAAAFAGKLPEKERGAPTAAGGSDISGVKTEAECLAYGGTWSGSGCSNQSSP